MPDPSVDTTRGLARTARVFTIISLVALIIAIAVNHAMPAVFSLAGPGELHARIHRAGVHFIPVITLMLFAGAADKIRLALDDFVEGRFFAPRAARFVSDAGQDVAWAIVAFALIVPNLLVWVGERSGGFASRFETETIPMFGFALFIVALGRILEQAAALKADNDAII